MKLLIIIGLVVLGINALVVLMVGVVLISDRFRRQKLGRVPETRDAGREETPAESLNQSE